jgi:transcriptional regulator CtsR
MYQLILFNKQKAELIRNLRGIIKKNMKNKLNEQIIKILDEKNLLVDRNSLNLQEVLGSGNFGIVYKALFNNDGNEIEVAVKTLKVGN